MKLCLIRHADAGGPDRERYPDDRLRPLTGDGEREHRFVARALARMGVTATRLLTSPLQRARETAEITAQGLGFAGVIEVIEALGDRFSVWGLLDELAGLPDGAAVVCVGHEPHLSGFAATLLHADGTVRIALPKSGVIGLECAGRPAPGACRLLFVLPPREMLRLVG